MNLETVARYLVFGGLGLIAVGGTLDLASRLGITPGRLPGDLVFRRGNTTIAIPIATSILLSVVLTLVINLLARFFNR